VQQVPANVRLVEVDSTNWRDLASVSPLPAQEKHVAAVTYYLCLGYYGGQWHSLGIEADGSIVGHVMWAIDDADGSVWLGGLVIDAGAQGHGYGKAAVGAFLDRFTGDEGADVALSYAPDNTTARSLYRGLGFVETGETEGDEIVARYRRAVSTT
jgi:diamine N-acetyltransferase